MRGRVTSRRKWAPSQDGFLLLDPAKFNAAFAGDVAEEKASFMAPSQVTWGVADQRLKAAFLQITLPLLIIHGAADKAAKSDGSRQFHEQAGSRDKTLKLYEGRYHDPLNDLGKEEVIADILSWIDSRL